MQQEAPSTTAGGCICRVGNGINWKGQIFPKLNNYTAHNRMTGVGNALKRHYTLYLLEYELVRGFHHTCMKGCTVSRGGFSRAIGHTRGDLASSATGASTATCMRDV